MIYFKGLKIGTTANTVKKNLLSCLWSMLLFFLVFFRPVFVFRNREKRVESCVMSAFQLVLFTCHQTATNPQRSAVEKKKRKWTHVLTVFACGVVGAGRVTINTAICHQNSDDITFWGGCGNDVHFFWIRHQDIKTGDSCSWNSLTFTLQHQHGGCSVDFTDQITCVLNHRHCM